MAKSANKTTLNDASVDAFINAIADERQCSDARIIATMMERLAGEPPKMWGSSIIGFGSYHYVYDSGREGDSCRIGFSPRKGKTVIYIADGYAGKAQLLAKLGKHKMGQACLYINKLADVDSNVLEKICKQSLAYMEEKYPL
jgi:Domain of unknown function (DU1801)